MLLPSGVGRMVVLVHVFVIDTGGRIVLEAGCKAPDHLHELALLAPGLSVEPHQGAGVAE